MNTRDKSESIVQELHDMACDGDVCELLVLCRGNDGRLLCAYASDDMTTLVDEARAALAEAEIETTGSRRLN